MTIPCAPFPVGMNPTYVIAEGSITVMDPSTQKILDTWRIPKGGSPDMGNVSADGKELWISGRYDDEVYVLEVNPNPFIADEHELALSAEKAGMKYADFIQRIVDEAVAR